MNKLRISVVHPDPVARWAFPLMHDGLKAAINIIGQKHEVKWFLGGDEPDDSWDFIMVWGVASMPFNRTVEHYKGKKILLCAGHPQDIENLEKFDAVLVESPEVYRQMAPFCKRIEIAFGTDVELFQPRIENKVYDAMFCGTFSDGWKRQKLFAEGLKGYRGLCVGTMQMDGVEGYKACVENGIDTIVGLVPTRLIATLYNMSKVAVIPAWHGSERSILEAQASNIPLVLVKDNELGCSLVTDQTIIVDPTPEAIRLGFEQALTRTVSTRKFILEKYSERKYAEKILKVIEA